MDTYSYYGPCNFNIIHNVYTSEAIADRNDDIVSLVSFPLSNAVSTSALKHSGSE